MDELIFIIISVILLLLLIISREDNSTKIESKDINPHTWRELEDIECFYHPVTGYKGTKSEMDTYIINREKKLKDE